MKESWPDGTSTQDVEIDGSFRQHEQKHAHFKTQNWATYKWIPCNVLTPSTKETGRVSKRSWGHVSSCKLLKHITCYRMIRQYIISIGKSISPLCSDEQIFLFFFPTLLVFILFLHRVILVFRGGSKNFCQVGKKNTNYLKIQRFYPC